MAKYYNKVETTKITGLCFDFVSDVDIQNGSLIAKGDLVAGEKNIYTAKIPAVGDEVFLVANPAWSYKNGILDQNEENYINEAGKIFRAYQLEKHNLFAIEDYGMTNATAVVKDDYVTVDGTTYVAKDVGTTAPDDTYGFVGKVIAVEQYGFPFMTGTAGQVGNVGKKVTIEVVTNETV